MLVWFTKVDANRNLTFHFCTTIVLQCKRPQETPFLLAFSYYIQLHKTVNLFVYTMLVVCTVLVCSYDEFILFLLSVPSSFSWNLFHKSYIVCGGESPVDNFRKFFTVSGWVTGRQGENMEWSLLGKLPFHCRV